MLTWNSGQMKPEIVECVARRTNTQISEWEFDPDSTKTEWLEGAREWYFWHKKLGMAKVWATPNGDFDAEVMEID